MELQSHRCRLLILKGVIWNSSYQIFSALVSFASMLMLVRIISPAEYGQAAAVIGILSFLSVFNCGTFMAQALQLPDGEEPDWSAHFAAGFYIQSSLSLLGHAIAGLTWLLPGYRLIAPLLHLGALGLFIDWPGQLGIAMLLRAMDFRRMRVVFAVSLIAKIAAITALGINGAGALAIVLGSNVVSAIPFGVDLLVLRRWRPRPGWWRWPDWAQYRPALRFGLLQAVGASLLSARGGFEATILPSALGFHNIGLWNRAQALFSTSVGQLGTVVNESVYPALPRYAAEAKDYSRLATLYLQVLLWVAMPATVFLGLAGPALSRILYGSKWVSADPMLWPGALLGFGLLLFSTSSGVLLAANRLSLCFRLNVKAACLSLPMLSVAWLSGNIVTYAWASAAAQLAAAAVALVGVSTYLRKGWFRSLLLPPFSAGAAGALAILAVYPSIAFWHPAVRLLASATLFGIVCVATYRALFAADFSQIVDLIPGSQSVRSWFRLPELQQSSAQTRETTLTP